MTSGRAIAQRFYEAWNARELDVLCGLLHDDVTVSIDSGTIRGVDSVRRYVMGVMHAFPGVMVRVHRVVAETPDTVVTELRLVNPAGEAGARDGSDAGTWHLAGLTCEIMEHRDGRIAAVTNYYAANEADRTDVEAIPSRAEAARIAEEQAALRRVATLVAEGRAPDAVFRAVNQEVARIVGADTTALLRFEDDEAFVLLAVQGASDVSPLRVGARRPVDPVLRDVRDGGRATRFAVPERPPSGPFADEGRRSGVRSSVGVPITVDGRTWGISYAATAGEAPFPPDTEERIAGFTELVATALINAQRRAELEHMAAGQAALRRVAELVARGVEPQDVFSAVTRETSQLLGDVPTRLTRSDEDGSSAVVAVHGADRPREGVAASRSAGAGRPPLAPDPSAGAGRPPLAPDSSAGAGRPPLAPDPAAVVVPIAVGGRLWGTLSCSAGDRLLPAGTDHRLSQFADLTAAAIANAEKSAQLTASRARVIATADETRRRLQRDVHDGAQQRLVQTVITLKLIRRALGDRAGDVAGLLDESLAHAERATAELRDLVHGMMPTSLVRGGLEAGIDSFITDMRLPVDLRVDAPRLAADTETTAYFIVAEALTNVVKHARASRASVDVTARDGELRITVRDDGTGGAEGASGSGLTGLSDRVAAAEGILRVSSPRGAGTTVEAVLPISAGAGAL